MNHRIQKERTQVLCPFLERDCPEGEQMAILCNIYFSSGSDPMSEPFELWTTCSLAKRMFYGDRFPPPYGDWWAP